ncbi:hypothetical protein HHK36_004802 [Tetracentron sinense]|uniref:Uncharacterized protein n=1 Tax=Tetracentron sinense TaxID=13715 RepID=A0A834ZJS1_TETSI|nr:hypothetical protein HHK36_004802 [Tetracentron sinense]
MFRFVCKLKVEISTVQLYFIQKNQSISTSSINKHSFTVSYLVYSCGLSKEIAIAASKKIHLQTSDRADSVLSLFSNHGFTKTHISKLITRRPSLLLSDPEKTLSPKIDFLLSRGISGPELVKMVCRDPSVLGRSVELQLIPSFDYLKSVLHTDKNVAATFKRTTWFVRTNLQQVIEPNIALLRAHGVPESRISTLLMNQPRALLQKAGRFNEILEKIKGLGFDSLSSRFVLMIPVITGMTEITWQEKLAVYSRWGWSEEQIHSAIRKQPLCMITSEKKIMEVMDFLVNTMGLKSSVIANCPSILLLSLEKRIIPRCSVVQVLLSKGLIEKDFSISTLLIPSEERFLKKYVTKYLVEVPQLVEVYHGKIGLQGLAIGLRKSVG